MKGVATEPILIIGVLIATGILMLQLRGVFYGETIIAQQETLVAFSDDLESIIDKASAVTGNASFVYYPLIKVYRLVVENNVVIVSDRISGETKREARIQNK